MSIRLDHTSEVSVRPPFELNGERRLRTVRPTIERRRQTGTAPLSFAQERLWFLEQITPGGAMFNLSKAIRLRGTLEVAALEKALTTVVARHSILRTTFAKFEHHANTDGRPRQLVNDGRNVTLEVINEPVDDAAARRIAGEKTREPCDLALGPLLRPVLIRLHDSDDVLVLVGHL